jgi:UDP-N-acetylglucosamine--N-acetylmuramyl-(pentapeptide) pyrophosphoryl-undecaprenol N-acetylglucosamine transferase
MAERSGAPCVVVAAGGTGGHLFPAEALTTALKARGVVVDLITDERATRYGDFPGRATHTVPSATFAGRDPVSVVRTTLRLARGVKQALGLLGRLRPAAVIGFGGYPTIPPVLAAWLRRIPTIIHEQNGVPGRANRFLAPRVRAIATGFPGVFGDDPRSATKTTHTGNPVRPTVVEAAATPYPDATGPLRILVFGGSQGARIMADIVPPAIELVPLAVQARLTITQQAREEDLERVRSAYARTGVAANVEPFFRDLPRRMAESHLVISRSGASTVAELAAIGRPAILVPLPHALDQDQRANAGMLERVDGAVLMDQTRFTPQRLASEIARLAADPQKLAAMAEATRRRGILDASDRLADLVLRVAGITAAPRPAASPPAITPIAAPSSSDAPPPSPASEAPPPSASAPADPASASPSQDASPMSAASPAVAEAAPVSSPPPRAGEGQGGGPSDESVPRSEPPP